jgi:hypothetical protein
MIHSLDVRDPDKANHSATFDVIFSGQFVCTTLPDESALQWSDVAVAVDGDTTFSDAGASASVGTDGGGGSSGASAENADSIISIPLRSRWGGCLIEYEGQAPAMP